MMKTIVKFILAVLVVSVALFADSKTGPVKQIKIFPNNVCFYIVHSDGGIYCVAFEKNTGKEMLAAILSAKSSGTPIKIGHKPIGQEKSTVVDPVDNSSYDYYVAKTIAVLE